MNVPPLFLWLPILVNYLVFWLSSALSRRSIQSHGEKNAATLLGIVFILSCIATLAGLAFRDHAITLLEIKLFGGKSAIWDYKYGKAVIRTGHEMYGQNTPIFVHILIQLVYLYLLCWPTHKSGKLWNSTALVEEKIDDLKNQ